MKIALVILVLFALLACNSEVVQLPFDKIQMNFITTVNQNNSGAAYYCRQGALLTQDKIYKNRDSIDQKLQNLPIIDTVYSIAIVKHDSSNYFDIGYYEPKDSLESKIAYAIAWKKEGGRWAKELEVLYPVTRHQDMHVKAVGKAREDWEYWSNQHYPDSLVIELYRQNAFYLNDGYIYRGRRAIEDKYAYMLSENWHIRLSTIQTMPIGDSLCYDIGQYVSDGRGHYFLLWQLEEDRVWRVLLDFNF